MRTTNEITGSAQVGLRLDAELVGRIDSMADAEHRNRTNMIEVLLIEALKARDERKAK